MISSFCLSPVVGKPFAVTIPMILVIVRMKVLAEKRMELSQTIAFLIGSIRKEKGCRRGDFCQSREDENELCLLEEWDTRENLKSHLKSKRFKVLRGAMNLLQEPYAMMFYTVAAGKRERKRGPSQQFNDRDDGCQRTISQTKFRQEEYHETQHEGPSGRQFSQSEG
jgi:quinol monooxygenase YgiN